MKTFQQQRLAALVAACCVFGSAYAADTANGSMNNPNAPATQAMVPATPPVSDSAYSDRKDQIESAYKAARSQCDSMAGTDKDVCQAQAKADRHKAMAQAEADRSPTPRNEERAKIAAAEGDYDVAKAKCGAKAGNDKDVCMKEAKAQETSAKADAKAARKVADARSDAGQDKRDANYDVAIQKCDSLAGDAKDACVASAKSKYGK